MSTSESEALREATTPGKLVVIAALCGVLFYFGLLITERIPEIPVDIDQKPFFIPLLFVALLPLGAPAWAAAVGAALGEAFGDILEGFEPDDPIGFFAYILGFAAAAYIIRNRPLSKGRLAAAALTAGFLQAAIEASSFLIFDEENLRVTVQSALGNTLTHGVIWGVIPLLLLVPALHGRAERLLGFPPLGEPETAPASAAE